MKRILVIKLGALGDVLRTTPLLRVLDGSVSWLTSEAAAPLLAGNPYIDRLYCMERSHDSLFDGDFDLVLNLEDDLAAATLASKAKTRHLIGAFQDADRVTYTDSASGWFDVSSHLQIRKRQGGSTENGQQENLPGLYLLHAGAPFSSRGVHPQYASEKAPDT